VRVLYIFMMEHENMTPMESPAPLLLGVAVIALLVLGSLFTTGVIWEASGPATMASSSSHAQAPHPAAKPATPPG
jgi:hypothetical protein